MWIHVGPTWHAHEAHTLFPLSSDASGVSFSEIKYFFTQFIFQSLVHQISKLTEAFVRRIISLFFFSLDWNNHWSCLNVPYLGFNRVVVWYCTIVLFLHFLSLEKASLINIFWDIVSMGIFEEHFHVWLSCIVRASHMWPLEGAVTQTCELEVSTQRMQRFLFYPNLSCACLFWSVLV